MSKVKLGLIVFLSAFFITTLVKNHNSTDPTQNSVMIVNKAMNHGGTGIIYNSTTNGSYILTNDHVCRAISTGGLVRTSTATYQVESTLESQVSDLCLVYVPSNLKQNTKVAKKEPKLFDKVKVSGHPGLLPTVVSEGHFSERQIITVMVGTRPCTDADAADPLNSMYCGFFGLVPIVKSYDSQLVTATIMPGSSGSGVYNSSNELSGVVFAGQGDFGYGWVVPIDQVSKFLNTEQYELKFKLLDQTLGQNESPETKNVVKNMQKKCVEAVDPKIVYVCSVIKRDAMWVK